MFLPEKQAQRTLRLQLLFAALILVVALWLTATPVYVKALLVAVGVVVGLGLGRWTWQRMRQRLDVRGVIQRRSWESVIIIGVLIVLWLLRRYLVGAVFISSWRDALPHVLAAINWTLLLLATAWCAHTLMLLLSVRTYERRHGSITVKTSYQKKVAVGPEAVIGRTATLIDPCRPKGTLKIDGVLWHAETVGGSPLPAGTTVVVRDLEGLTLIVEPTVRET